MRSDAVQSALRDEPRFEVGPKVQAAGRVRNSPLIGDGTAVDFDVLIGCKKVAYFRAQANGAPELAT
jgi:hypothetical protein